MTLAVILLIIFQSLIIVSTANQKISNDSATLTSSPVITPISTQTNLQWGQKNTLLIWEVDGGKLWTLWKNGTQIRNGTVLNNIIEIKIENWQLEDWQLGTYNLTLNILGDNDTSATSTLWVHIYFGDEYANSVLDYAWIYNETNAIGAPDGEHASLFPAYGNGYLILDMGDGEEIIDGNGDDVTIVAQGGNYSVRMMSDLIPPYTYFSFSNGSVSIDLAKKGLIMARYIYVEYYSGPYVELDAIVAIHYNQEDVTPPQITGPSDFQIWSNQTTVTLTWEASDATPWNYTVIVNETHVDEGPWNGSTINYTLNRTDESDKVNITLVLYDLFENHAEHMVTIEIRPITTTPVPASSLLSLLVGFGILLIWKKYHSRGN